MKPQQVLAYLLILHPLRESSATSDPGENAQEFGVLCSIAELADREPQLRKLEENINASSLLEDFNNFELLTRDRAISPTATPDAEWMKKNEVGNSSLVDSKIGLSLKKANEVATRLSLSCKVYQEKKDTIEQDVKRLLKRALFGADATESTKIDNPSEIQDQEKVFADLSSGATGNQANYAKSCASNVKTVGKTLVNDMFCLCVGKANGNGDEVCADTITGHSGSWPKVDTNLQMPASWEKIYAKCPKPGRNLTAENIRAAIGTFQGLLGKHAFTNSYSTGKTIAPFFFGKAVTNYDCNGTNNQNVCVNYKTAMTGNVKKGLRGIAWVDKYLTAAYEIEQFNQNATKCENDYQQLLVLHTYAQSLFQRAIHDATGSNSPQQPGAKEVVSPQPQAGTTNVMSPSDSALVRVGGETTKTDLIKFIFFASLLA